MRQLQPLADRRRGVGGYGAILLAAALLLASPGLGAAPDALVVFAAASLADVLQQVGEAYRDAGGGPLEFNFAASNVLAHQIAAGAPADLFLSADELQVKRLVRIGHVFPGSPEMFAANSLVVVVPAGAPSQVEEARDLLAFERLALADPEGVPGGVYARRWLEAEGLWPHLARRVVPLLDVRAVLASVARGNLPAGIVYSTDAATTRRVRVAYRVEGATAPKVRYWAVSIVGSRHPARSSFLDFLRREQGRRIFAAQGFRPVDGPGVEG